MGRLLVGLGIAILALGLFGNELIAPVKVYDDPFFTQYGSGATGQLVIPPAELNNAVEEANLIATTVNRAGIGNASFSRILLFFVVLFGGLTALLAGIQKSTQLGKRYDVILTVTIGLLGAASAIATSGSRYLDGRADERFECVEKIEEDASSTRRLVMDETDAGAARQLLADLIRGARRCEI